MIDLAPVVPLLKAVHILALIIWCGGLLALPMMLAHHDPAVTPDDYRRIRYTTHISYTFCVTPAAVTAVIAGTWLIFARGAFEPWLYAKLFFVAALSLAHAWVGMIVVKVDEAPGEYKVPPAMLSTIAVLVPIVAILFFVLAKPALDWIEMPAWLLTPRGNQLPLEIPSL